MYGVILSAKIDMFSKDPPVKALNKSKAPLLPLRLEKKFSKTPRWTPGVGMHEPSLTTTSINNVNMSLLRISWIFNAFLRVF